MLFLELALIRWIGANIVHLGVLLELRAAGVVPRRRARLPARRAAATGPRCTSRSSLALLVVGRAARSRSPSTAGHPTSSSSRRCTPTGPPAVADAAGWSSWRSPRVMAGPARSSGGASPQLPRLEAYRLDLLGSLVGHRRVHRAVVPAVRRPWCGAPVAASLTSCARPRPSGRLLARRAVADRRRGAAAGRVADDTGVFWSPYYKVSTSSGRWTASPRHRHRSTASRTSSRDRRRDQAQLRAARTRAVRARCATHARTTCSSSAPAPGTDVAIALAQGAEHVDAVEIDPRLLQIGAQLNPDQAYQRPARARARQRRPGVPRAHRPEVRPDPLRAARLADPGRPARARCGWRATCSPCRRCSPPATTSRRAARSRCTTSTASTGWSTGSPRTVGEAFGHAPCVDALSRRRRP